MKSLTSVSVRNEDVSYVGDNFEGFAGHLKEVDLQDNLIWQWSEVKLAYVYRLAILTYSLHRLRKLAALVANYRSCYYMEIKCKRSPQQS